METFIFPCEIILFSGTPCRCFKKNTHMQFYLDTLNLFNNTQIINIGSCKLNIFKLIYKHKYFEVVSRSIIY